MKQLLFTTVAAVVLVGCATTQSPEPPTAKAPDISIHEAAMQRNLEAVKQHIAAAAAADVNAKDNRLRKTPLDVAIMRKHPELAELLRKHGGKTGEELKTEEK